MLHWLNNRRKGFCFGTRKSQRCKKKDFWSQKNITQNAWQRIRTWSSIASKLQAFKRVSTAVIKHRIVQHSCFNYREARCRNSCRPERTSIHSSSWRKCFMNTAKLLSTFLHIKTDGQRCGGNTSRNMQGPRNATGVERREVEKINPLVWYNWGNQKKKTV